ncbi:spore coat protein [Heliorestis convoluta]|uniref:Coat F domain protein n=1 Tax=Heliorestis convoluta TaxID=356322 RepID=A0A5Q2N9P8_9FIRM|nr:spore coat protein [Heliorestis convoluta]QGG49215.1 Coat F domain protein [Heliorestis convoluta]
MTGAMKLRKASSNDSQGQKGKQNKKGQQNPSSSQNASGNKGNSQNSNTDFTDRDRLFDVMVTEKNMSSLCNRVALETGNDNVYRTLMICLNETQACQREFFHFALQKGWYHLRPADPLQMQQLYQQYQSYTLQFPYGQQSQNNSSSDGKQS